MDGNLVIPHERRQDNVAVRHFVPTATNRCHCESRCNIGSWQSNIMMERQYYVYIMTNKHNTVLYTGVTNDLKRRVYEHDEKMGSEFTRKYNLNKLVYYEIFNDVRYAITREKQIKAGSRVKKIKLITALNPDWDNLYNKL